MHLSHYFLFSFPAVFRGKTQNGPKCIVIGTIDDVTKNAGRAKKERLRCSLLNIDGTFLVTSVSFDQYMIGESPTPMR